MATPKNVLDAEKLVYDYLQGGALSNVPPPPVDTVAPPYGVHNTLMTIFGLDWDGKTFDPEDNGKGAWGADTRNPKLVGCALPIKVVQATFGNLEANSIKGWQVEVYSQVTLKTVYADIVDLGPAARVHRLIDGTYGLHEALGHISYATSTYGALSNWPAGFHVSWWLAGPAGAAKALGGIDFAGGRVIGS